jgi:hypothetical protein
MGLKISLEFCMIRLVLESITSKNYLGTSRSPILNESTSLLYFLLIFLMISLKYDDIDFRHIGVR